MKYRIVIFFTTLWRFLWILSQLLYGVWRVSKLQTPLVTIFGGSRILGTDFYFQKAHEIGKRLAGLHISVLTGGGPGIMAAASCGAVMSPESKTRIMGIGVTALNEAPNKCVQEYFTLDHFFARKWLLTRFSSAFIVFPGGFGTLDELSEVLTLIQTKRIAHVPIILFGTEYWALFMKWLREEALKHGTIDERDLTLFTVTDDLEDALCLIGETCKVMP